MECIHLRSNKLGIHFSYNKKIESDGNFLKHITSTGKIHKLWQMRKEYPQSDYSEPSFNKKAPHVSIFWTDEIAKKSTVFLSL